MRRCVMHSVPTLIQKLGGATAIADRLGLKSPTTVASWKQRGSIPVEHWPRLVEIAQEKDVEGVNYDELVAMHLAPAQPETAA